MSEPLFNKVAGFQSVILSKRDSDTGVFFLSLQGFSEIFYWTPPDNCFFWKGTEFYYKWRQ